MNNLNSNQKKIIIIAVVLLVMYIIGSIVYFIFQPTNKVAINNFDSVAINIPKIYKEKIFSSVYNISSNNSTVVTRFVSGEIRKDSFNEVVGVDSNTVNGSFIVDLKELKQSYLVTFSYYKDNSSILTSGYPISISCLPKSKLIYGDFKCKDMFNDQSAYDNPEGVVSPYKINFTKKLDNELSEYTKNTISSVAGKFIINNIDPDSIQANITDPCSMESSEAVVYKCQINLNNKIVNLDIFINERNSPQKVTLQYGDLSESYNFK